jgi:hypothetical protein
MIPTPTPYERDHGTPPALNPDTNRPMPSASASQEQLADNVLAQLLTQAEGALAGPAELYPDAIRAALVEVAVRQHGRTLRACIAQVREHAAGFDGDARTLVEQAVRDEHLPADPALLSSAARLAAVGSTLRTITLGGTSA